VNQDVYIFSKKQHQEIVDAEFLKRCGIKSCADETDEDKLDPAIRKLWCHCLDGYPRNTIRMKDGLPAPKGPPDPDEWFDHYVDTMDDFVEEGGKLPLLCRSIAEAQGLVYPELHEVDQSFIRNLKTPDGTTMSYEQVFKRAQQNIIKNWRELGAAFGAGNPDLLTLANGDLDTGLNEDDQPIFWSTIV
jgi:hypothetical protein